jgi:hypothetical protein
MRLRILIFAVVFFWLAAIPLILPADLAPNITGKVNGPSRQEGNYTIAAPISIEQLIRSAVSDNSWMFCSDRHCLNEVLSRYYTGPLLESLSAECLQFNELHTDWYSLATVSKLTVVSSNPPRSYATAGVIYMDIITGRAYQGQGAFVLLLTPAGWRIELASYNWQ